MKESWFKRNKVKEVLTQHRKFLDKIQSRFDVENDFPIVSEIGQLLNSIDWILEDRGGSLLRNQQVELNTHEHRFVNNGYYNRNGKKIQIRRCSICNLTESVDKIRSGLSWSQIQALIQLKLEGLPMKRIAQLLQINTATLEYHWNAMKAKPFGNFIVANKYPLKLKGKPKPIAADFFEGSTYSIRIWNDVMSIKIDRYIDESTHKNIIEVRLAQILLASPRNTYLSLPSGIFGHEDFHRIQRLIRKPLRDILPLTKPEKAHQIFESKTGEFGPTHLSFSYDRLFAEGPILGMHAKPKNNKREFTC